MYSILDLAEYYFKRNVKKCKYYQIREKIGITLGTELASKSPEWFNGKQILILPINLLSLSSTKLTAVFSYSASFSSSLLLTVLPTTSPLGSSNRFVSLFKTTRQHWNRIGPRVFALVAIFGGIFTFLCFPFIWEWTHPGILIPASVTTFRIDTNKLLNRVFLPTQ